MDTKRLTAADFAAAFNDTLPASVQEKINRYDFSYTDLTPEEREGWMKKIADTLAAEWIVYAGEHRLDQWESGWGENLTSFKANKDFASLLPRYFGKYNVVRWRQDYVKPLSKDFEYHTLAAIEHWLFEKHLKDLPALYEFGAGTGHNLFLAREANPTAKLFGMDWATSSQELIKLVVEAGMLSNVEARRFDFFNPDSSLVFEPNAGVYTVAALEQVGDRFKPFIEYLIKNNPKVCVHMEPIAEVLDPTNEMDRLSIAYFKKRNYLNGFLDHLRALEKEGRITLHQVQRSYVGSLFIEGYSVVVWSPNK